MRRNYVLLVASTAVWWSSGCSGLNDAKQNAGNSTAVVRVSPSAAIVDIFSTQPFTATVTGSTNAAVTWQVNGVTGGTQATGFISSSGLFTAPHSIVTSLIPKNNDPIIVTVTAISQVDSTATSSAAVTLLPQQQTAQAAPIKLGTSGGNVSDTNNGFCCGGTLGSLVVRNGTFYILSNNHVLAKSDFGISGDSISQPAVIDVPSPNTCTTVGTQTVAHLSEFFNLQTGPSPEVDAALAQIVSGEVDTTGNILLLGATATGGIPDAGAPHAGTGVAATPGQSVAKSGRTTGLTCSAVLATNVAASVDYYQNCGDTTKAYSVNFTGLVSVAGGDFSGSGDSGSLVVTQSTADPVALLFAGSDTDTVANTVSSVVAAFPGAGNATPTFVGGAAHQVIGCTLPTQSQSALAPQAQVAAEVTRAVMIERDLRAPELLANAGIHAIGVGRSYDDPGQAAILLFITRSDVQNPIPQNVNGVRTRVIEGENWAYRGMLSTEETSQMMQQVLPAQLVYELRAGEMERARGVQSTHQEGLLKNPDVLGVGITASVDSPGEAALLIYVRRGAAHDFVPAEIGGVRTRVRETSSFKAGGERGGAGVSAGCKLHSALKERINSARFNADVNRD
jgi:hypothetical protein